MVVTTKPVLLGLASLILAMISVLSCSGAAEIERTIAHVEASAGSELSAGDRASLQEREATMNRAELIGIGLGFIAAAGMVCAVVMRMRGEEQAKGSPGLYR
jgi:hypothetical protein